MRPADQRFMQSRRHRQTLSLLGALLYAVFAFVLPSLHLGFHRADHDHRGGGLPRLHTELGGHHSLVLMPHRHDTTPDHELGDAHEEQDAGVSATTEASDTKLADFASLRLDFPAAVAEKATAPCTDPGSELLDARSRPPHGSSNLDPAHGSGSYRPIYEQNLARFRRGSKEPPEELTHFAATALRQRKGRARP